jgi:hypothetical protein
MSADEHLKEVAAILAAGFRGLKRRAPSLPAADSAVSSIVVYRMDRLSRSLIDFLKLMDVLDDNDVSIGHAFFGVVASEATRACRRYIKR